jgi:thioredoxin reductase
MEPVADLPFEVTIVGGGPAGLAAALVLGRMRRRVLLLDADDPAHAVSDGVHGFFAHDGIRPLELRRTAREQLHPYESVTLRMATVEHAASTPSGFSVRATGATIEARFLLLCMGLRYELPSARASQRSGVAVFTTAPTVTVGRCAIARSLPTGSERPDWHCS